MGFAVAFVELTQFECVRFLLTQGSVEPAIPAEEAGTEVMPEVGQLSWKYIVLGMGLRM